MYALLGLNKHFPYSLLSATRFLLFVFGERVGRFGGESGWGETMGTFNLSSSHLQFLRAEGRACHGTDLDGFGTSNIS